MTASRRTPAIVELLLCAFRGGQLQVLVAGAGRDAALPSAWPSRGAALEVTAHRLGRTLTGTRAAWLVAAPALIHRRRSDGVSLSLPFIGIVAPSAGARNGSNWIPLDSLAQAPSRHRAISAVAMNTLRAHVNVAPVAFHLLSTVFTLAELQQVYELLLGHSVHKASFRRALHAAGLVTPTREWRREGRGRPAQLFRYAPRRRPQTARRTVRFDLLSD